MDGTLWIAIVAVFLVSIVFSMFGQGGGSLYTPILFLLGFPALTSISTSLALNLFTALSASIVYFRSGLVDVKFALWFVPGICLGAFIGGRLAAYVDPSILMWLFVVFLLGAGARMISTYWEKGSTEESCPARYPRWMYALIAVFSFVVGIISGLLGVGGGILIVPFLIFLCRYPTKNSAGVVSFIVIFSSLFGVAGHLTTGGARSSPDPWYRDRCHHRCHDRRSEHGEAPGGVHQGGVRCDPLGLRDSVDPQADPPPVIFSTCRQRSSCCSGS